MESEGLTGFVQKDLREIWYYLPDYFLCLAMRQDCWYLEGYFSGGSILGRVPLRVFPFQIGRDSDTGFNIPCASMSRVHAVISKDGERLFLQDNNSTNGTFVNRQKLTSQAELQHGDIVHFADFEARVIKETIATSDDPTRNMAVIRQKKLSQKMSSGVRELQELLEEKSVMPVYQPIIDVATQAVFAYEVLGRGTHPGLTANPGPLFHIAESLSGLTVPLSHLFREVGVAKAAEIPANSQYRFFLNIHPDELKNASQLLQHMDSLRQRFPSLPLVLEIHEKAVTNISNMKVICQGLDELGIELAYDDFGAGQTRFIELIEAPSHYLKFDISLVGNIDKAPPAKRNIVKMLVKMSKDMGISTLAEGLDRAEEVEVCQEMGFDYIQGFYYGKPQAVIV